MRKRFARLFSSSERLLAIDVGSRVVKVAEFRRRKDVLEVVMVDAMPVPCVTSHGDVTPAQVVEALKKLLYKHGIKNGAFISILPREFVTIKRFELPSTDRAQIAQMIPFEAEKHLPFPLDRAQTDFSYELADTVQTDQPLPEASPAVPVPAAPAQHAVITLAAARLAAIPKFLELLTIRGFKQSAIEVSTFALFNAFSYYVQRNPNEAVHGDNLLVEIGARRTEILLVSAATGSLVFSRAVDFGGDALTEYLVKHEKIVFEEAEKRKCEDWDASLFGRKKEALAEALNPLIEQVQKTMAYVRSAKLSQGVKSIWLSGGTGSAPGFADFVRGKTNVPVHVFDPLAMVGAQAYGVPASAFAIVVGTALRMVKEAKVVVDLLPVDISKLQIQAVRRRRLIQLGVVAGALAALWLLWFGFDVASMSFERSRLERQKELLLPQVREVGNLERQFVVLSNAVTEMQKLIETKTSWTRVFQTIAECMNSNVWARQITVSSQRNNRNKLTIEARAVSTEDYIDFKNNMSASLRFRNVDEHGVDTKDIVDFSLECDVLPDYQYQERVKEEATKMGTVANGKTTAVSRTSSRAAVPRGTNIPPTAFKGALSTTSTTSSASSPSSPSSTPRMPPPDATPAMPATHGTPPAPPVPGVPGVPGAPRPPRPSNMSRPSTATSSPSAPLPTTVTTMPPKGANQP